MANFDLTSLAVKAIAANNEAKVDSTNLPSIMVYVPKFKLSDVLNTADNSTHPAFIVNGKEIAGFWMSKYQNKVYNNVAYSLPGEDPTVYVDLDTARVRCEAKGEGWHVTTAAEWAALALWCKKNGTMPKGNNNYGKDTSESSYKAIPKSYDDQKRICRVATGTGPLSWSHDGTPGGIWDLNGNIWEWCEGLRIVYGEVQILKDNDAADQDNPKTAGGALWKAIDATTGDLVQPNGSGTTAGTVKLDYVSGKWKYVTTITNKEDKGQGCLFGDVTADTGIGDKAKLLLRALAMLPDDSAASADYQGDYFYANNGQAERCLARGGNWYSSGSAGVFDSDLRSGRGFSYGSLGFRSALIEEL